MNPRQIDDINSVEVVDSYKVSHPHLFQPGTQGNYYFFESRGGLFSETCFFGLQYYLMRYLQGPIITKDNVDEAAEDFELHFAGCRPDLYSRAGWQRIIDVHGGHLPVRIKAVPEGLVVPTKQVLFTFEGTDETIPWTSGHLETMLSMVWYPMTVATQSREMKKIILRYLEETGTPELIDFKLHDFGFRGSTSIESAGIGGAAHLVNFKGTDTLQALRVARKYYGERMAGFSIPAAEHSTTTSWGREREGDAFEHNLDQNPTGLVAQVSDSYDIFAACTELWGKRLKQKVLAREGVTIIRPDSGDPPTIVVMVLDILGAAFGFTVNQKGYKVLNPKVRVIQGDGIDIKMLPLILEAMKKAAWSADNIAFGSGGGLLQKVDRDTQKCAIKCSATKVNGVWHDVYKDPITDPGKKSKAGRLKLILENGQYRTVAENHPLPDQMETVFENGQILKEHNFADIRARAAL